MAKIKAPSEADIVALSAVAHDVRESLENIFTIKCASGWCHIFNSALAKGLEAKGWDVIVAAGQFTTDYPMEIQYPDKIVATVTPEHNWTVIMDFKPNWFIDIAAEQFNPYLENEKYDRVVLGSKDEEKFRRYRLKKYINLAYLQNATVEDLAREWERLKAERASRGNPFITRIPPDYQFSSDIRSNPAGKWYVIDTHGGYTLTRVVASYADAKFEAQSMQDLPASASPERHSPGVYTLKRRMIVNEAEFNKHFLRLLDEVPEEDRPFVFGPDVKSNPGGKRVGNAVVRRAPSFETTGEYLVEFDDLPGAELTIFRDVSSDIKPWLWADDPNASIQGGFGTFTFLGFTMDEAVAGLEELLDA